MFWHFSPTSVLTKQGVSQGSSELAGLFSHKDDARRQLDVALTGLSGCASSAGSLGVSLVPRAPGLPGAEEGSREPGHLYLGAISPAVFDRETLST